jgi:hypothetical protein
VYVTAARTPWPPGREGYNMSEIDPEENAFDEGVVIKKKTTSSKAPSRKTTKRRKAELFARITERHCMLLADVKHAPAVILFCHLMMYSVTVFHCPFKLPVEYLTKKTGMNRRPQLRALRNLAETGLVKTERENLHSLPVVVIPGTTKVNRKTT